MASPLSIRQIEALALKAGATASQAVILAAIAKAESGGDPTNHNLNVNTGDNSYGLWQINMLGSMGPARRQQYGLTSNDDLFNPLTNAKVAVKMMGGGNFSPWTTYTNGAFRKFLPQAEHAIGSASSVDTSQIVRDVHHLASGGGTVTVTGGTPQSLKQQPMTVKQYLDSPQIAQTYGYLAAYLHNKQIGPILAEAAKKGWGQDELLGALEKTKWWKNTAESTRSWQAQQRLDPATARQRLHQMQQQIQQLALSTLGSRLDPDRAAHMANAALSANWNQAQLQAAIGAEWHYQGAQAKYKGAAGQTVDQLQQLSQQFLVPVAHHEMQHWGRQILEGSTTVDDYKSYLQSQAESLYPTLTHALKSGQTVAQFADPYLQMASQILEKPVGDFNLFNPKWGKALNTVDDQGQRGPMSLADWGDYLRGLPDYRRTQQAQQQGAAFSNSLLNIFGKVSTPNSVPSAAVGQ